ncbi:MAG: TIGR02281 family clan AA aspartic protease [candidate division NC10 bacterium]|nr:TIGR02281 family clan AA aspartic protease [candidate division NC10 bacterium]
MKGTVSSQNGIRLEAALVEIEGVARVQTDSTGHFFFHQVPAGFYKIVVSKAGFPTINRALLVKPDRTQFLEIILPGTATLSPEAQVTAVPLLRRGSVMLVAAHLCRSTKILLLLDTGATYSAISTSVAEQVGLRPQPGDPQVTVMTASGALKAPLILLPSLMVGGFEAKEVEALILDLPGGGGVQGILGLSFLNRFRFSVNPQEEELVLQR